MKNKKLPTLTYKEVVLNTLKEDYVYILLGLTIIVALFLGSFLFIPGLKTKLSFFPKVTIKKETLKKEVEVKKTWPKTYVVKPEDYLWKIAEETYGSGYNAYDIAEANNITDPSTIFKDQVLVLPEVTPKMPTVGEITAEAASTSKVSQVMTKYTVVEGDSLWEIAVNAYGDGYAWPKIAEANKLENPSLIHPGNELIIPPYKS